MGPIFGDLGIGLQQCQIYSLFSFFPCFQSFYGDRFGHDFVEIIKDSNTVEREKLDSNKVRFTGGGFLFLLFTEVWNVSLVCDPNFHT